MVIKRASHKCLLQRTNCFPTNVEMSTKITGLVAYLRADQTLQIKDLHCKDVFSKVDFLVYKLGLCLHPVDRAHLIGKKSLRHILDSLEL